MVSKNNLQRCGLPGFSFSTLVKIKVEKSLDKNLRSKHLAEVFKMFLFFGILKNKWSFAYERIFLALYNLVAIIANQANITNIFSLTSVTRFYFLTLPINYSKVIICLFISIACPAFLNKFLGRSFIYKRRRV